MDPPKGEQKAWCTEVARLGEELEQARVALEDAHIEIAALTQEREQLRLAVTQ
jgi:hypothetical protein